MTRDSMVFYSSFAEAIKLMPKEQQLEALWAIIDYGLDDTAPDQNANAMAKVIFQMAKPQIDANVKRKANGMMGGRPKNNGFEDERPMVIESENHRLEAEKPNVNVNDNVNGNGNVNVYEYTEEQFGRTLAPAEIELIKSWDYSEKIIKLAVDETVLNQVNSIKYTDKILYEWDKQGLKTVNDIKSKLKQRREKEEDIDTSDVSYYRSLE